LIASAPQEKIGGDVAMDDDDRLRLEYDQAGQLLRNLAETRLRLLALVPTASGAVVALIGTGRTGVELLAIGGLGFVATLGLLLYELSNEAVRLAVEERVRTAESALLTGGPLTPLRAPSHMLGTALVFGAALGGWTYLVVWGALRALGAGSGAQGAGLVLGVAAALGVGFALLRRDGPARAPAV
jgi:hypothetical protein